VVEHGRSPLGSGAVRPRWRIRSPTVPRPRAGDELPDIGVDEAVDLPVEVQRPDETGVGTAVVVVVQLLAGDAHLLHDVLVLDP
jgi:hypothetical protein